MIKGYKFEVRQVRQKFQGKEKIIWVVGYMVGDLFHPVKDFATESDAQEFIKNEVQTDEE